MELGAHLPLISFAGESWSLQRLVEYTRTARELGYTSLTANDHFVFPSPWLDGPTALAAVIEHSGDMSLMTTVSIPVVRGLMGTAKTLGAIDLLSGGRLIVGVGPGSSAKDYEAVGVDFDERWKRLDDAVPALRALWSGQDYVGRFYSTEGIRLEPLPAQRPGPPIWIGSWGSEAGLRRTARLADGWLASAYNTTPKDFADARARLAGHLKANGKDPEAFPNGLATMFMYVTEDAGEADRIIEHVIGKTINRPEEELRERLLVGSAESCAAKLAAYQEAGLQRVLVWPVENELHQLTILREQVAPQIGA